MSQIVSTQGFVSDAFADRKAVPVAEYDGGGAVLVDVAQPIDHISNIMQDVDLIVIPFATFADGRGFSLARQLRASGYAGHLRARGAVLVDQFRAALRVGFDDIEIDDDMAARAPQEQWLRVVIGAHYRQQTFAIAGE